MSTHSALPRRQFLCQSAGFVGLGLAGLPAAVLALGERKAVASLGSVNSWAASRSLADLKPGHFEGLVGERFLAGGDRPAVTLALVDVQRIDINHDAGRPSHLRREPFTLIFRATGRQELPSGTYRLQQAQLGEISLFLHPVRNDNDAAGRHYEVIFN